ncbi:hypothetical protein [Streptomyces gibsoniae]|uniref:Uncharacterized protein n=1 Tax=Streptomyces gibsoniae TaxID=3075529 RepID=A0ABU2U0Q5_9ACTN|nr:hypothetical protein [Streptomyces sp. DSM 41699]MDT0466647.1 hypothetical protein [Streptomyces sp. DSM 41699]
MGREAQLHPPPPVEVVFQSDLYGIRVLLRGQDLAAAGFCQAA